MALAKLSLSIISGDCRPAKGKVIQAFSHQMGGELLWACAIVYVVWCLSSLVSIFTAL